MYDYELMKRMRCNYCEGVSSKRPEIGGSGTKMCPIMVSIFIIIVIVSL